MTWANIVLVIKYLPQVIELAKRLEATISDEILKLQIKRNNDKIELIFLSDKPASERARDLNDVFKG